MKNMTERLCQDIFHSQQGDVRNPPTKLTEEEKDLLVESLPSGQLFVFESHHFGCHVATAEKHWFSEKDETYQEYILQAFKSLCKRGFIRHKKLCMFQLSHHGIKLARQLVHETENQLMSSETSIG